MYSRAMVEFELVRITRDLARCDDLGAAMHKLGSAVRRLTGADGVTVVLREGGECHYADEDAIAPLWKGRRFPMESCISGWTMLQREPVAIPDIYADSRIPHDAYRPTFVKSLAMVPIREEDPFGAIGVYWEAQHTPTADEMQMLQVMAEAAVVMRPLQRIEQLKLALQDAADALTRPDASGALS